jgi:hypothetical protein
MVSGKVTFSLERFKDTGFTRTIPRLKSGFRPPKRLIHPRDQFSPFIPVPDNELMGCTALGYNADPEGQYPTGIKKEQIADLLGHNLPVAALIPFLKRPEINALIGDNQLTADAPVGFTQLRIAGHQDHLVGL